VILVAEGGQALPPERQIPAPMSLSKASVSTLARVASGPGRRHPPPRRSRPVAWCRTGSVGKMVPATAALIIVGLLKVRQRRRPAMAGADRMTIEQVVRRVLVEDHADVIRESVKFVAEQMMEAEVSDLVGAELGERRPEDRATHRNGYRPRRWDTRAGEIELQIPKLRQGSYFPSFLTPRKRSEQALVAVVQQAYVRGLNPPRRSARGEPWAEDQQERGVARVRGAR
jgi:hypothetical protein